MKNLVKILSQTRCIEACFTGGDIAWSADGRRLYTTCTSSIKEINLFDNLATRTIGSAEEKGRITALTLDHSRERLLVAYSSGLICEYSIKESDFGTLLRSWKPMHSAPILIVKFNSDGSLFATASSDHNIKVWDVRKQTCLYHLAGASVVTTLCFVRNGRLLSGYMDGTVTMYSLNPGVVNRAMYQWKCHQSQISSICEIADTRKAVLISRDQTCTIIDMETTKVLKSLPLFEAIECGIVIGEKMLTVGEKGEIVEWITETAQRKRGKLLAGHSLKRILYNPTVDQLLIISAEEIIYLISASTFNVEKQIVGFHDEIFSTAIVGKTSEIPGHLVVAANSNLIRLYNLATWDCRLIDGHTDSVLSVRSALWNHSIVASCSKDNTIKLWKLDTEKNTLEAIAFGTGHTNTVSALVFSHHGKESFVLSAAHDTTLKLWDLRKLLNPSKKCAGPAEEKKLICSSTIVAHQKNITCVECSPNDALCLTASMDKTIKLWKIDTGRMQLGIAGTLTGHKRGVWDAKFSPNAQKVVSSSGDQTLKIWSVGDFSCLQTISGHSFAVLKGDWINNGSQLISADSGGVIKIWKLENNGAEAEASIEAHDDKIWSLCFTEDESQYITAGGDGRIIIWKDVSDEKRHEEDKKRREKIEQEQTLSNLLEQNRYLEALEYSLNLNRPFGSLKVVTKLSERDSLDAAFAQLDTNHLRVLLDFASQWNTNSRTATMGQQVLQAVLLVIRPEDLLELPNFTQIVEAFLPYTKRHAQRLDKARQDVSLLEYTVAQMRLT
ncbi:unnamed protein product, partial [Mesorhabditis belari]|uniref:U3 small nucleolar RNA-associated protein 15 homolog n=1 Tax=Mesorhabditis belari TaxID=2138241 RepID=A0AAF3F010_9BILA